MSTSDKIQLGTLVAAVLGLGWAGFLYVKDQQEAKPILGKVSVTTSSPFTSLTVQNQSPQTTAAVSSISYVISDETVLNSIAKKYPRGSDSRVATSHNVTDQVLFRHGYWDSDGNYRFYLDVEVNIEPGKPNTFLIGVANEKLNGMALTGTVYVDVWHQSERDTYEFENVSILPKPGSAFKRAAP